MAISSRKLLSAKTLSIIKKSVLKNPKLSASNFFKKYPKIDVSMNTYFKYRIKYLTEAGREDELPTQAGRIGGYYNRQKTKPKHSHLNKLYSTGWRCSIKEFQDDPLKAFQGFLKTLIASRRGNFELLKIEVSVESKWVPYYEIRES